MTIALTKQTLGNLACAIPGATRIFRQYKLDFCCGGQVPLAKAAAEKGLDLDAVMRELAALQRSDVPPAAASPGALIDAVETAAQENMLITLGCDVGQGYLYSPALAAEDVPLALGHSEPPRARRA